MAALTNIRKKLDSEYVHGYGPSPLPNQIDKEVEQFVDSSLAETDVDKPQAHLPHTHGVVLLAVAMLFITSE